MRIKMKIEIWDERPKCMKDEMKTAFCRDREFK